ncbi:hypothetical protein I551_2994 [Mycobacterium ulcerans str. Harvey]|uniref:Uncharacterized protein n=1 Tax=Mycobacterium ulcerans str. Harvey TaxID=1299332 RepID=A0ABP3ALM4_MYCUL|nr:hypothetical protein I551_2994 [Mycobacterium ulcerans str. Harvey]
MRCRPSRAGRRTRAGRDDPATVAVARYGTMVECLKLGLIQPIPTC